MIKLKRIKRCYNLIRRHDECGFNLIELFMVTTIISILAAMSVILVARAKVQARETAALSTLSMMTTAYEEFHFRYREYPQWGPGQRFNDPRDLINSLVKEGFLPSVFRHYEFYVDYNMFSGFAEDYYLQILPYDPEAEDAPPKGSYFIVLVPHNYQRRYLAAIYDPTRGKVTVKARKGDGSLDGYRLFTFAD
jgi:prepilin-type N-terminal cleavage/methylation domain-containing protein